MSHEGYLEDVEAIKILKARYFRCMDTKQWDGWRDVFAPDAVMDTPEVTAEPQTIGVESIIEFCRSVLEGAVTVHHGHMPEIEVLTPTTARGIWALYDMLLWEKPNKYGWNSLRGAGHYHETYVKTDAGWRIKSLALSRLWLTRS